MLVPKVNVLINKIIYENWTREKQHLDKRLMMLLDKSYFVKARDGCFFNSCLALISLCVQLI